MKKKYSFVIMIIIMTVLSSMTAFAGSTAPIKVTVNSKTVKYDVKPYMHGKEVMIPLKQTAETLGAEVETDKKNKTVWVNLGMLHAEFPIGKSEFYIHRDADFSGIPQTVKLNTPVKDIKGIIFVPGKSVFENIGMTVSWDSKKRVLAISNSNSSGADLSKDISYTEITKDDISGNKVVYKWYNANYKNPGVRYMKHDDVMYVLVGTGSKPTGGYTVGINKISYDTETKAIVSAYFKSPTPDMMVTQAETFPHMLIKIEGYKNLKKLSGEVQERVVDTIPTKVAYDEISADDIKGKDTLDHWYKENNQKSGIYYISDGKFIYVLIGAGEKSTGGYTITIDNVVCSTLDTVTINARVNSPGDNGGVITVISYPSKLIRIETDTIKTVIGEVKIS